MPPPKSRRIRPTPVNRTAMTSNAMRRIANKERVALKIGRNRVNALTALKILIRNGYLASLAAPGPAFSNYQRRAATPYGFKPMSKANLNRLLFRKRK
jgi:hypothetical protein